MLVISSALGSVIGAPPGVNEAFFNWAYVLQLVTNGLANGAVYGLMAITVVIVYRTTGHLNFAQGEMGTMGCFLVFSLSVQAGVPYWISIPGVMALSMLVGALIQRGLVQPVEVGLPLGQFGVSGPRINGFVLLV